MSDKPVNFEVPAEMRDFAEKSVEQARKAFDGFLGAASKAVAAAETQASTVQTNSKDMAQKAITYTEQNVTAAFELAQKVVRSKDPQEVLQHQAEFMRAQIAALQGQMKEFGTVVQSSVQKATAEAQATLQKATAEVQKTAAEVQKAATEATKRR
jgi:phasin